MKKKIGRIIIYTFLGFALVELAEGCVSASKKCGCGSDLMNAYRRPRRR
ncbi:hypothetical protein [Flavipsychrobacter stenotrophus]|nr:hypothetical protein [Flavipsychrobacter stenotrophus]